MDNGFILLSRNLLESDVFASQKLLKIWIWCLLKANFKDRTIPLKVGKGERIISVKRGSFIFGRYKAEDELFIDGSTIYKSIKKLESLEMINIKSNNQYSVITISNYDTYQNANNYQVTTEEQPSNNQVTAEEQPSNNQVTAEEQPSNTTKKVNKVKKVNKEKKEDEFNFKNSLLDLGVEKQIVDDWMLVRKKKNATDTKTSFDRIKSQIEKSNRSANECIKIAVEKDWKGFSAEWLKNLNNQSQVTCQPKLKRI